MTRIIVRKPPRPIRRIVTVMPPRKRELKDMAICCAASHIVAGGVLNGYPRMFYHDGYVVCMIGTPLNPLERLWGWLTRTEYFECICYAKVNERPNPPIVGDVPILPASHYVAQIIEAIKKWEIENSS